jgi:hypothetical protein
VLSWALRARSFIDGLVADLAQSSTAYIGLDAQFFSLTLRVAESVRLVLQIVIDKHAAMIHFRCGKELRNKPAHCAGIVLVLRRRRLGFWQYTTRR